MSLKRQEIVKELNSLNAFVASIGNLDGSGIETGILIDQYATLSELNEIYRLFNELIALEKPACVEVGND